MDDGIYSFLDHNSRNYRDDGSEIPTFGKSISFEESDYEMKTVSNYDEENADRIRYYFFSEEAVINNTKP